ncbi:MAG: hypothetical protein ACPGU9_03230 [Flavobacteriaceae bacterium]
MKKLIYLSTLLISLTGFSQTQSNRVGFSIGNGGGNESLLNNSSNGAWITSKTIDNGIDGSEYVYMSWSQRAVVTSIDGKQYVVPFMNFNARLNRFAANLSKESKGVQSISRDSVFMFNNSGILKVKLANKDFVKVSNKFYEVVFAKNDTRLLKLYKGVVKEASFNPMTQQKVGKDKMVVESSYFIEKDGLNEFKLKTKTILSLLSDKESEIKKFIKENKLSVKNEKHLIRVFNYYKSL